MHDDAWLKAAAWYLPQVARVRPARYPVRDSETATALRDELDFLRDVDPGPQATAVAGELETLVTREETARRGARARVAVGVPRRGIRRLTAEFRQRRVA